MSTRPRRLGKYELHERLGQGGMGEVWKAFDPQLQRYVAIKLLHADLQADPGFVARFKREAQFIASLHHPNIVQIHDFQFADTPEGDTTTAYMVMDYVEGQTLANYLYNTSHKGQMPTAADIIYLFTSISSAIDYAHHKGMIHRDIKPANILLDKRLLLPGRGNPMGEPILTDFGIARLQGTSTATASRFGLGTPLYISPEQAQGQAGDGRSDLYSLGVILYEMLTGATPFHGDNPIAILMQHLTTMPTPPASINPNISPAASAVVLRSLAKNPDARFPSASSMTAALAEALNVPIPAELRQHTSPTSAISTPADSNPPQPTLSPGMTPPLSSPSFSSPQIATPPLNSGQISEETLTPNSLSPLPNSAQRLLVQSTPPVSATAWPTAKVPTEPQFTPVPTEQPTGKKRRGGMRLSVTISIFVSLFLVAGLALGLSSLLSQRNTTSGGVPGPVVGHVLFSSSGQFGQNTSQGIVDQLTIDLHNISAPPSGKSYYAWLLGDNNNSEAQPISLGKLSVNNGSIHFSYTGDQQHDNLIANTSRFLITAEDTNTTPIFPSTDPRARLYHAAISQTPSPTDTVHHYSLLDHLRHLLSGDPSLDAQGLHGGLDIWLLRNTQAVSQWATDAQHTQNTAMIRQRTVDILYYLDSQSCVQSDLQGAPQGTPTTPENATILNIASVGLLQLCSQQKLPGYFSHIASHLNGVTHAPGATSDQLTLTSQITMELNHVNALLEKVHQDAQQLVKMTDAQLLQSPAQSLLNDMATQASHAYSGQTNSSTSSGQPSVQQIHKNVQHLATFDVTPCPSSSTSNVCA